MFGFISLRKGKNFSGPTPEMAVIGEDGPNDTMVWNVADYEYCEMQANAGILERRGYTVLNSIFTWQYYLPPPPHEYNN